MSILILAAAGGCAAPPASIGLDGRLAIFEPGIGFASEIPPDPWTMNDAAQRGGAALGARDGVPALRLAGGRNEPAFGLRMSTPLLATPYLHWGWQVDPASAGDTPLRLVIAFRGGRTDSARLGDRIGAWLDTELPAYDRAYEIAWGNPPGAVVAAKDGRPRFVLRGGPAAAGRWWVETADLSELYRRTWPADEAVAAKIVYVGVVGGDRVGDVAYLAELILSK